MVILSKYYCNIMESTTEVMLPVNREDSPCFILTTQIEGKL
jgi:hypothetical protein